MAFDEGLAQRLREIFADRDDVAEKKMFGGLAFMLCGNMCCGVVGEELMARVGPDQYASALKRPFVREMDFTGKPLKGFVYVGYQGIASDKDLARISHQAAQDTDKTLAFWSKAWIVKNTACYSSMPITVQAGLRVRKLALHSKRSYCYAFRSRAALSNTSPPVSPGGEMITQRFGLMKYIPVFHPFGVALRSKSVPDGFVTKDFANEWNNRVYFRLSKMLCGFKDQVRARPSGETGGLHPSPAPVILVRNAG